MKKEFSFYYNGEKKVLSSGGTYKIDDTLTVTSVLREFPELGAYEWVQYFENTSTGNSGIVSDILDCDTLLPLEYTDTARQGYMPKDGSACVITMRGTVEWKYYTDNDKDSAVEFGLTKEYLDKARGLTKSFANSGGRSSNEMMPFFDVTASGSGYITAIGWTGDWRSEFTKQDDGIAMRTGLKETKFFLEPGEKIRTSSTLVMEYSDDEDKYNKFRKLIRNHFSHTGCTTATREGIMANELWGGLPSEEMKKRLAEYKKYGIGFDDIWIDAGWYGKCEKCDDAFSGDWSENTGDWSINTRVHPGELLDVSESAKAIGANLMLWFEPERAIDGTPVTKEHRDWFLTLPQTKGMILNYGNSQALDYAYNLLNGYIKKLEMSCYRQDFNVNLTDYFRGNDAENRRGITEIKHITGLYRLWDMLLADNPGLLIDNCASGGRRIDIETIRRSIPFFRSDYQCAFNEESDVLQSHNSGISKYLPYNGCTSKTKSDTYAARSSFSSSWGGAFYNAVFQSMDEADFAWAKKITDEYRRIRKYFPCNFYSHGSEVYDRSSWAIWQYHDADTDSGIVMAFRRENSPFDNVKIKLNAVGGEAKLKVENLNDGSIFECSDTLEIRLPEKRSSVIFEYWVK